MDVKNIIQMVVAVVIGVIMIGPLVSVVTDAQTDLGDPITLTNTSSIVLREAKDGDVLKVVRTVSGGTTTDAWTLNDEAITGPTGAAGSWDVGIMSDGLYLVIYGSNNSYVGSYADISTNSNAYFLTGSTSVTYSMTFDDGNITIKNETTSTQVATAPYTWGYVMCPYGDGEYCAPISGGVGIVKDPEQVILCGLYSSGDLDTVYYYINGAGVVGNSSYDMDVNISTALHSGTTDIYDATVSVTITDGDDSETFTPYRILVPYQVSGHATAGAAYDLLGVIPLLVTIGLILGVVGVVVSRRME